MKNSTLIPEKECGDKIFVGSGNIYESSCVKSDYFYRKPDVSTYILTNSKIDLFSKIDGIVLPIRKKDNIKTEIGKQGIGIYIVKYFTIYTDSFSNVKDLINYYITYDIDLELNLKSDLVDFLDESIKIKNGKPINIRMIKFIEIEKIINEKVLIDNNIILGLGLDAFKDMDKAITSNNLGKVTLEIEFFSKSGDNIYLSLLNEPVRISPRPNGVVDLFYYTIKKDNYVISKQSLTVPDNNDGTVFKTKNEITDNKHSEMFSKNIGEKYDNYIEEKTKLARDLVGKLVDDNIQMLKLKEAIFKLSNTREEMEVKENRKDIGELIKIFKVLL